MAVSPRENFIYRKVLRKLWIGEIDVETAGDMALIPVMDTTTTGPTGVDNSGTDAEDLEFVGDATTLAEHDGFGYSSGFANWQTLANVSMTEVLASNLAQLEFDDEVFASMQAGTAPIQAFLLVQKGSSAADSILVAYLGADQQNELPFTANGGDITVQHDSSNGLIVQGLSA